MSGQSDTPSHPVPLRDKMPNPKKSGAALKREERLKAALKANMARRKAQARAKAGVLGDAADKEKE